MSFLDFLQAVPAPKVLSIRDLDDLDNAELKAVHEAQTPVKLRDEAA